jgi:hypothetical protein
VCVTYGPSDQVKTCPKPHDRTSFSAEARDLVMLSSVDGNRLVLVMARFAV